MKNITTFSDMNKSQKELWIRIRETHNILNFYKYKFFHHKKIESVFYNEKIQATKNTLATKKINMTSTMFENTFVQAFAELSRAQDFHNRNNSKRSLSYADMKPENFKTSFFHSRISEPMRSYVKILYDVSLYSNNIVNGFLLNVQHRLRNCTIIQKSEFDIEHIYICDFKKTKTMLVPSNPSEYLVLCNFISDIIMNTDLLSFSAIKHGKRIKQKTHFSNDTMQKNLRTAVNDSNHSALGKFAATLVWILYTKQMSVVQNASMLRTGMSYCNGFNLESRILKSNPSKKLPKTQITQPTVREIFELEEEKTPKNPEKIENENVPDSWEDLDI